MEDPRAADRARAAARDTGREGVPQATLSEWEPPSDDDDDRPILNATEGGGRRGAPRSGPVPVPMEDQATAVGLPDEHDKDDDAVDTDRHPRLPRLPGITEEGASGVASSSPTAPRPARREGRSRGQGPTRDRADRPARDRTDGPPPTREAREPRGDAPAPPQPDARDDASLANIFLNVGRRDGVDPGELQRLLADSAGIPEAETSNIRVRDRITFVTVKKELADRAIKALAGHVVGGRTVIAEPARDKA